MKIQALLFSKSSVKIYDYPRGKKSSKSQSNIYFKNSCKNNLMIRVKPLKNSGVIIKIYLA